MNQTPDERLDYNLELWRDWMRSRVNMQGYPSRSTGMMPASSWDTSEQEFSMDCQVAEKVDALIRSLREKEKAAVEHIWLGSIFRYCANELEVLYFEARDNLIVGMRKRGIA